MRKENWIQAVQRARTQMNKVKFNNHHNRKDYTMAITDADLFPEVDVEQLIGECYLPFPADVIKIRQDAGTGNKALSYVGHPDYTRRLDAIFPFAWDFRTEVAGITDSTVAVKGSLSITLVDGRTITRENYGHGQINKGFPLGDALKTAAVDAQKKCCSMFGIGLHLYDGDDQPGQTSNGQHTNGHRTAPPQDDPYSSDWEPPPREQGPEKYEFGDDPSPATSRQIIALQNISKSRKTDPALAKEIKTLLETPTPDDSPRVSKAKASELISRAFDKD